MTSSFTFPEARKNMDALRANPYPGRGIVMGVSEGGYRVVQVYWLMGRSSNSRNRVLTIDNGRVFTEAADPAKVQDPSLIIYTAMRDDKVGFVVSNGVQTDGVFDKLFSEKAFKTGMRETYSYEPDEPNFTARITGVYVRHWSTELSRPLLCLHMIRRFSNDNTAPVYSFHAYEGLLGGVGYMVTTYAGDGNPLPVFKGGPLVVAIPGSIDDVANTYWSLLNEENRIALAVKFIDIQTGSSAVKVINKFSKTP